MKYNKATNILNIASALHVLSIIGIIKKGFCLTSQSP